MGKERVCFEVDKKVIEEIEELLQTVEGKLSLEEFIEQLIAYIAVQRPFIEMALKGIYITGVTSHEGLPQPSPPGECSEECGGTSD